MCGLGWVIVLCNLGRLSKVLSLLLLIGKSILSLKLLRTRVAVVFIANYPDDGGRGYRRPSRLTLTCVVGPSIMTIV